MTDKAALQAADELLSDPARWTQNAMARDATGRVLEDGTHRRATSWCAAGALEHVTGRVGAPVVHCLRVAAMQEGHITITNANDHGGYDAVRQIYRRAIADA